MTTMENLVAERDRVVVNVTAIRTGAAGISELLAGKESGGDDWERAALVLARCREERKQLDNQSFGSMYRSRGCRRARNALLSDSGNYFLKASLLYRLASRRGSYRRLQTAIAVFRATASKLGMTSRRALSSPEMIALTLQQLFGSCAAAYAHEHFFLRPK